MTHVLLINVQTKQVVLLHFIEQYMETRRDEIEPTNQEELEEGHERGTIGSGSKVLRNTLQPAEESMGCVH